MRQQRYHEINVIIKYTADIKALLSNGSDLSNDIYSDDCLSNFAG